MLMRSFLAASILPLLSASISVESLSFNPAAGTEVSKVLSTSIDFELQDLSIDVAGLDVTEMIGEFEVSVTAEVELQFIDTYQEMGDGYPLKLTRLFESMTSKTEYDASAAGEGDSDASEMESPLVGEAIVFTYDEEAGEFVAAFTEGSDADPELLTGLDEDLDLRSLLPQSDVAKGDTWEVPLKELQWLLAPGGDLRWTNDDMEAAEAEGEEFMEMFGDAFDELGDSLLNGACVLTMGETIEVDGAKIAQMTVKIELDASEDMSDLLADLLDTAMDAQEDLEEMPDISIEQADIILEYEGEGTFEWNLTAGHMRSFELSGEALMGMELAPGLDLEGESQDVSASLEMVGNYSQSISAE